MAHADEAAEQADERVIEKVEEQAARQRIPGPFDLAFLSGREDVTELLLIRHGQQELRDNMSVGEFTDPPLSELGESQARLVGMRFSTERIDHVYASPLKRALETGREIARHHRLEPIVVDDLQEVGIFRDVPPRQDAAGLRRPAAADRHARANGAGKDLGCVPVLGVKPRLPQAGDQCRRRHHCLASWRAHRHRLPRRRHQRLCRPCHRGALRHVLPARTYVSEHRRRRRGRPCALLASTTLRTCSRPRETSTACRSAVAVLPRHHQNVDRN